MDLTRKKIEIWKFSKALGTKKIRQRERKLFFSKKGKTEIKAHQNREDFAHTTNKTGTHVRHLAKRSNHIYCDRRTLGNEKMRTITIDHIQVLVHYLDNNGIGGQLMNMWINGCLLTWMTVNTLWTSLWKVVTNTLKTEITPLNQLIMGNGRRTVTAALMSHLDVTDPHSKREFIAINAIIHLGATDKHINPKLGYIKPTSKSKKSHEHLISSHVI